MNREKKKSDSDVTAELLELDVSAAGYQSSSENIVITDRCGDNDRLSLQHGSSILVIAAAMAALGGVLFGYDIGIISGALLQLKDAFDLDCHQAELLVSAMLIGAIIASLIGGFLVDYFGRRVTIIVNSAIFVIGAIILATSPSYPVLVFGRVVVGFGVSLSAISECVYISEIAPPRKRGLLVSLNELGITLGFLMAYLVNYGFIKLPHGWRYMFGLSAIPAFLQGVGMFFLPSSPRYLMIKLQEEKAKQVLQSLRQTTQVDSELTGIRESLQAEQTHTCCDLFRSTENMRSRMLIGAGLVFFQQFTGQPNVLYYAPTIFQSVGFHSNTAATMATVGLGIVKVIATVISLVSVDKVGRRLFLIVGGLTMCVSILVLGIVTRSVVADPQSDLCYNPQTEVQYCILYPNNTDCNNNATNLEKINRISGNNLTTSSAPPGDEVIDSVSLTSRYVALVALMVFVAAYGMGFGPVSWLILSEIFPSSIKGRAIALTTVLNWSTNLVVSMTFLDIMGVIGISGTFFVYSLICAVAVLYVFAFIPETKNRSLEQISSDLRENSLFSKMKIYWRRLFNSRLQPKVHMNVTYHRVQHGTQEVL